MPFDRPQRVLIVDDSELERMLVRQHLRDEPTPVDEAADGESAIALASLSRPDAILLDLNMPGLSGFEVLRRFKDDPATRSIPVIILSGTAATEQKVRALDLGAVDYITKPFDPAELRARLRVAFRLKYCHDLLEERAHLDALTGLANRHALNLRLESEWALWRRRGQAIAMMILDLDHFKRINDRFGHAAGDEALRRASGALRAVARASDLVARFGGEEFVLIAPDCDLSGAIGLAERAREQVEGLAIRFDNADLTLTASIGVASIENPALHDDDDPRTLFARADRALYEAKTSGRNAVWAWCPEALGPVRGECLCPVPS